MQRNRGFRMTRKKKENELQKESTCVIKDETGKLCFEGKSFESFDDAEEFLFEILDNNYETDRDEYYIVRQEK